MCMKKVLVVEDNRLERRLIMHILQKAFNDQIQLDEANDGHCAITILSKAIYDLVITDLIMPNIEGLELISKIKSQYPTTDNILAISGGNPYYLYLAKKMGVQGVFTKPLHKEKFLLSVKNILYN
jgi:two-component system response regulator YesN